MAGYLWDTKRNVYYLESLILRNKSVTRLSFPEDSESISWPADQLSRLFCVHSQSLQGTSKLINKIKKQQIPFISFPMHDILFILKCSPLTSVLSIVLLNQTKHNVRWSDQTVKENFTSCIWEGYILKQLRILYHKQGEGRICINCGVLYIRLETNA